MARSPQATQPKPATGKNLRDRLPTATIAKPGTKPVGPSTGWAESGRKSTQPTSTFVLSVSQQSTINVPTPEHFSRKKQYTSEKK